PHALRANHRHAKGKHRQEDLLELGAARFRSLGVNLETLAERTLQLCAIPSPIGEEAATAAFVQSAVKGERIGNAVVAGRVSGSKPAVILAGHIDTVPLQD